MQPIATKACVLVWLLVLTPLIANLAPVSADANRPPRRRGRSPRPPKSPASNGEKRYILVSELPNGLSTLSARAAQQDLVEQVKASGVAAVDLAPKHKNVVSFRSDPTTAQEIQANTGARLFEDAPRYPNAACPGYTCPQCTNAYRLYLNSETTPYGISQVQANDPSFLNLTGGASAKGVTICMLDFGIDPTHPDLQGNNITGKPFYSGILFDWNKHYNQTHAQHVLGIMVAAKNRRGVVGVISGGTNVYVVNIFGNNQESNGWNIAWAWDACYTELLARQKTDPLHKMVVHMSLGGPNNSYVERAMLQYLYKTGNMLFFGSAGNDNQLKDNYPASYDEVIGVTAVDCKEKFADFSNFNMDVELTAPGVAVLSDYPQANNETVGLAYLRINVPPGTPTPPCVEVRSNYDGIYSRSRPVSGRLIDCGRGTSCRAARGQICIIDVGKNQSPSPCERARKCKSFGAVAAILVSQDCGTDSFEIDCNYYDDCDCGDTTPFLPSVGISTTEAAKLRAYLKANAGKAINGVITYNKLYDINDGTSMSTPHASAVAAKLWSRFRNCTNVVIRQALTTTAKDLGPRGRDVNFGFGLVQARRAAEWLSRQPCGRR